MARCCIYYKNIYCWLASNIAGREGKSMPAGDYHSTLRGEFITSCGNKGIFCQVWLSHKGIDLHMLLEYVEQLRMPFRTLRLAQ